MGRRKQNIKISKEVIDLIQDYANVDLTMCEVLKKYPNEDVGELHESILNKAYIIIDFLIQQLKIKAKINKKTLQLYEYWNKDNDIFNEIQFESEAK